MQVPTEFAGAFYSPVGGAFYPRITRVLHGPAQVIHVGPSMGPGWCAAFNDHAGKPRQMVVQNTSVQGRPLTFLIQRGRDGDRTALMDGNKSLFANATETEGCRAALGVGPPRMKIRRCSYQVQMNADPCDCLLTALLERAAAAIAERAALPLCASHATAPDAIRVRFWGGGSSRAR